MIPESTADIIAMPTVPNSHFLHLSFAVMYGLRSSVPGMVHAFVCPTQKSSTRKRSIRFMTDRITSNCQKPARNPRAPFTAYLQGGLTYESGKTGILLAVEELLKED